MKSAYLLINLGAIIIPFIFSFHPKLNFYRQWKAFFKANLIVSIIFLAWDVLYTHIGVWGFNDDYLIGIRIFKLPLEEYLFFFCIPYACLFTWHCFEILIKHTMSNKIESFISLILITSLILIAIVNIKNLYTSITFFALSFTIIILRYIYNIDWLGRFYLTYTVLLLPFFIVNGLLTGTALESPIVWYDNNENLGIRILTIPVEDIFYGMLLIMLNISLFKHFQSPSFKNFNPIS